MDGDRDEWMNNEWTYIENVVGSIDKGRFE